MASMTDVEHRCSFGAAPDPGDYFGWAPSQPRAIAQMAKA